MKETVLNRQVRGSVRRKASQPSSVKFSKKKRCDCANPGSGEKVGRAQFKVSLQSLRNYICLGEW